jgi:type IX secretion system PorP/SprF family membrane protein
MSLRVTISLVLNFMLLGVFAQDPQFSQFYATGQYLNPAFAGNTFMHRAAINYRQQWAGIHKPFRSYLFSYDYHAPLSNSGFGVIAVQDQAGTHDLSFSMLGGAYSYNLKIDRKHNLRFGMRYARVVRYYDSSKLLFADQVIRDNAGASIEPNLIERASYSDISSGAVYHSEHSWVGVSVDHLNRPDHSLRTDSDARLPMRFSVHSGHRFLLNRKGDLIDRSSLIITANYKSQGKWDQFDVGGYVEGKELFAGIQYRGIPGLKAYAPGYPNNDALTAMVGFRAENQLRIGYSYDMTISWLGTASGGAHEIAIVYEWPREKRRGKYKMVPCPKF